MLYIYFIQIQLLQIAIGWTDKYKHVSQQVPSIPYVQKHKVQLSLTQDGMLSSISQINISTSLTAL